MAILSFSLIIFASNTILNYYDPLNYEKPWALAEPSAASTNSNSTQTNAQTSDTQNFQQYHSDTYRIGIKYPSGWTAEEGDKFLVNSGSKNIVTIIPPNGIDSSNVYHVYLSINIYPNPENDLNAQLTSDIDAGRSLKGFSLAGANTNAIIAGQNAYEFTYTDSDNNFDAKTTQWGTVIDGKEYFIIYTADRVAYDAYLPVILQILSTLQTSFGQGFSSSQLLQGSVVVGATGQIAANNSNSSKQQETIAPNSTANQPIATANFSQYNSTALGFSIQYPIGSAVIQRNNGASFVFTDGSSADVIVGSIHNMTLNDFTQNQISILHSTFPGAVTSTPTDRSLSGYPGRFVILQNGNMRGLDHWTVAGGIGYQIFFIWNQTTAPNFISLASKIAGSFQITNQAANNNSIQYPSNNGGIGVQQHHPITLGNFSQYQSPNFQFNITYPVNWTAKESSQGVSFIQPQGPYVRIGVNVTENKTFESMKLSDYTNTKINDLRAEFKGFHLESENDTILSGNQAHYLTFSFIKNSTAFFGTTAYTIVGNRIYELGAITPVTNIDNILPTFRTMKDSFSIFYQTKISNSTANSRLNNGSGNNNTNQFFGYSG